MTTDIENIVDAYLRHYRFKRDEDFWAWEKVDGLVRADLSLGWEITLLLLSNADTDEALAYIAAGPLEDLLDGYGDSALERVEQAADLDPRLQFALGQVWLKPDSPIFNRWMAIMQRYGFADAGPA